MGKLNLPIWLALFFIPTLVVLLAGAWFIYSRQTAQATPSSIANLPTKRVITKAYAGYTQIVLLDDKQETFLTDDRFNNLQPFLRGDYIVWLRELPEEKQVVRYHIKQREALTVHSVRQAQSPKVSATGQTVWQRWENEDWYISYFDGQNVQDLPIVGLYPDFIEEDLIFARRSVANDWELVQYNLTTKQERVLAVDPSVKQAWVDGEVIRFPSGLVTLTPTPSPSPMETTPPLIIDPETTPNEPDQVTGEPSRIPPGDARLIYGEGETDTDTQSQAH